MDFFAKLIGKSPNFLNALELGRRAAETDLPILIDGATGVGKDLLAEAIHYHSERKKGPFVPIDCGALLDTLLESELFGDVKGAFTGADADRWR